VNKALNYKYLFKFEGASQKSSCYTTLNRAFTRFFYVVAFCVDASTLNRF